LDRQLQASFAGDEDVAFDGPVLFAGDKSPDRHAGGPANRSEYSLVDHVDIVERSDVGRHYAVGRRPGLGDDIIVGLEESANCLKYSQPFAPVKTQSGQLRVEQISWQVETSDRPEVILGKLGRPGRVISWIRRPSDLQRRGRRDRLGFQRGCKSRQHLGNVSVGMLHANLMGLQTYLIFRGYFLPPT